MSYMVRTTARRSYPVIVRGDRPDLEDLTGVGLIAAATSFAGSKFLLERGELA